MKTAYILQTYMYIGEWGGQWKEFFINVVWVEQKYSFRELLADTEVGQNKYVW